MKLLSKENAKAVPPSREIGSSTVVAGMLSAPKRGRTAFSSDWVAAYCHREKGGAPQYFNHDMEMAISKDVKSLNSNELNILSAEFCSNCSVTEQRFFLCVCLS